MRKSEVNALDITFNSSNCDSLQSNEVTGYYSKGFYKRGNRFIRLNNWFHNHNCIGFIRFGMVDFRLIAGFV